jgi:acetyl-CoA acetyltransferase
VTSVPHRELRGKYAVAGVGTTTYGRLPGYDAYDLGAWALTEALADCGLPPEAVDGLIVNRVPDYQRLAEIYGISPRWVAQLPTQGRMSGASIELAVAALEAGLCEYVALVYGNNGRSAGAQYGGEDGGYGSGGGAWSRPYGMTSPGAFHALMFRRHMALYGTTSEQLAAVPIAFRKHASLNPQAVMRTPIALKDHQSSRFIAEPLHLLDYCLINDGGVALVVTGAERARALRKPSVYILGFGQATELADSSFPPDDFWRQAMRRAQHDLYEMSGVGLGDLDGAMIYDNFSPTVLFTLEGFGFCPVGESGAWVQGGRLELGGELPTNTSGGHLSESYMQGWGLNVEAVRQLRGECGERQIPNARVIQYMAATPVTTAIVYGKEI